MVMRNNINPETEYPKMGYWYFNRNEQDRQDYGARRISNIRSAFAGEYPTDEGKGKCKIFKNYLSQRHKGTLDFPLFVSLRLCARICSILWI
jgi:hypothetical protein